MRLRLAFLSLGLVACEVTGTTTTYTPYSAVYVDPTDFTGGVACSGAEGAMQSYVATLIDVTTPEPVVVGSSPPTSCRLSVGFSQVTLGHFYVARIDAYTQPACSFQQLTTPTGAPCLVPVDSTVPDTLTPDWASGSRDMGLAPGNGQAPTSGPLVAPTWTTTCGRVRTSLDGDNQGCTTGPSGSSGASGQAGASGQSGAAGQGGSGASSGGAGAGGAGSAGASGSGMSGAGAGGAGAGGAGAGGAGASGAGTGGGASGAGAGGGAGGLSSDVPGASGQSYLSPPYPNFCSTDPTEAVYQVNARMAGCVALAPLTGAASLRLDQEALRGGLRCGSTAGTIQRYTVQQEGGDTRTPDCNEELLYTDLTPGAYLQWRVFAYEPGSTTPRWGAICRGRASAGLTATAACDALRERGSLRLSGAELCTEGVAVYRASVVGSSTPTVTQQCPGDVVLVDQSPGLVEVLVERRGANAEPFGPVTCEGQVLPGLPSVGSCSP